MQAAVALSAARLIGRAMRGACTLMLGPDAESEPWLGAAADAAGCPSAACRKRRHGVREVDVELPHLSLAGEHVAIVDDVASTGRTMRGSDARQALAAGARRVDVAGDARAHGRRCGPQC